MEACYSELVCLFVSRVSAFECLLPDELNLYLQKSPGYSRARWYVSGSPYLKTTPPENSLVGRRYCRTQAINKSSSTLLSLTPCPCEAWHLGCEVCYSELILVGEGFLINSMYFRTNTKIVSLGNARNIPDALKTQKNVEVGISLCPSKRIGNI
jgi:hypothetical protein